MITIIIVSWIRFKEEISNNSSFYTANTLILTCYQTLKLYLVYILVHKNSNSLESEICVAPQTQNLKFCGKFRQIHPTFLTCKNSTAFSVVFLHLDNKFAHSFCFVHQKSILCKKVINAIKGNRWIIRVFSRSHPGPILVLTLFPLRCMVFGRTGGSNPGPHILLGF